MHVRLVILLGAITAGAASAQADETEEFDPFEHGGHAMALSERERGETKFEHEGVVWSLMNWGRWSGGAPGMTLTRGKITAAAKLGEWRVHLGQDEEGRPYGFVSSKRSEAGSMLLELGWECGEERSDGWNIEVDDPGVHEEATHHVGLEVGSPVAIRVDDGESMRATAERLTTYSGAGAVSTLLAAPADLTDRLRKGARVEIEGTVTSAPASARGWGSRERREQRLAEEGAPALLTPARRAPRSAAARISAARSRSPASSAARARSPKASSMVVGWRGSAIDIRW